MKQVKYFTLLIALFFISTNTFCSEKNQNGKHLSRAAGATVSATGSALAWGLGPVESMAVGAGVGACSGAASKGWEEYQRRQAEAARKKVWDDRKKLAKDAVETTVKVAAAIQTVAGAAETLSKLFGS